MSASVSDGLVTEDEWLARYIVRREHVRADGTVKPDPFIPYRHVELSVTRHKDLEESAIWAIGESVARKLQNALLGRADTQVRVFVQQRLTVKPDPQIDDPNHANVVGWPADKQAQKEIAIQIVKQVGYKPKPITVG